MGIGNNGHSHSHTGCFPFLPIPIPIFVTNSDYHGNPMGFPFPSGIPFPWSSLVDMLLGRLLLRCRPGGSDLGGLPAQLLQPPTSHSPVLRKTNSHPHSATKSASGPSKKGGRAGNRQSSPPPGGGGAGSSYHPRAQSIPTGSVAGCGPSGDAAMVAARADRLKAADEHKSRSKSGSPRQVERSPRSHSTHCDLLSIRRGPN